MDISSTQIRKNVLFQQSIKYLVPELVKPMLKRGCIRMSEVKSFEPIQRWQKSCCLMSSQHERQEISTLPACRNENIGISKALRRRWDGCFFCGQRMIMLKNAKAASSCQRNWLPEMYHHEGSEILHGPIGAHALQIYAGVKDEALLDAIQWAYTEGFKWVFFRSVSWQMQSKMERDYPRCGCCKEKLHEEYWWCGLLILKHTLEFLLEKEVSIFPKNNRSL